ncbi:MAG: hypothetical protein IPG66_17910 [Hydrogenophilales bacterium]|nr:hypothetical protein [Hydrogenophilales bacterium]
MAKSYTATVKRNPGRKSWLVEFRHPLRNDSNNKPGKKTRKGLGTEDEQEARRLGEQINELLKNESLWSLGAGLKHQDFTTPRSSRSSMEKLLRAPARLGS